MSSSGGTPRRLTQDAESESWPAYSPDGAWIVFGWVYTLPPPPLGVGGFASHLIKISSDGTQRVQLTNHDSINWLGQFSPDSQEIAFASTRDGQQEIYLISQDGTNLRRLTQNPAEDSAPSWADQNRILFASTRDYPQETSFAELYSIRRDGTEEQRLSSDLQVSSPPSLSPQSTPAPGQLELNYAYDALSRLVSITEKNQAGEARTYTFGYRSPGDRIAYMKGPDGEVIHKTSSAPGIGAYAQVDEAGTWRIFQMARDQRGDTFTMVLPDGRIPKRQSYSDYGSQAGLPSIPYGFLGSYGRLHIPQTGLDLLGARLYDSRVGRFLTKDPIPGGSSNAYEYAGGDPINRVDPAGTDFFSLGLYYALICAWAGNCPPAKSLFAAPKRPNPWMPSRRNTTSAASASGPAVGDPRGYRVSGEVAFSAQGTGVVRGSGGIGYQAARENFSIRDFLSDLSGAIPYYGSLKAVRDCFNATHYRVATCIGAGGTVVLDAIGSLPGATTAVTALDAGTLGAANWLGQMSIAWF